MIKQSENANRNARARLYHRLSKLGPLQTTIAQDKIRFDEDRSTVTFTLSFSAFSSPPLPDSVFEGDIVLTKQQLINIDIHGDIRGNVSRAADGNGRLRWPNGIIPYEIDCSLRK